jgi:hypothetical protein
MAILRAARSEPTGIAGSASFSHRQGVEDCVTATHASLSGSSLDSSHTQKWIQLRTTSSSLQQVALNISYSHQTASQAMNNKLFEDTQNSVPNSHHIHA